MNWANSLAPRYHLSLQPDASPLRIRRDAWTESYLAFDQQTLRFVSLHTFSPGPVLAPSIAERVYLAARISHPGLFNVLDFGERPNGLFYATELADGEPLPAYLQRVSSLPLPFALPLALQLTALLRYLANFPPILDGLSPDDLHVTLSPGLSLGLRFAVPGSLTEDRLPAGAPVDRLWLPQAAQLLWDLLGASIRHDPELKFSTQGPSAILDPFAGFLHLAQTPTNRSASQAFRDLEEGLHRFLRQFHGVLAPHYQGICPSDSISLRPKSLLLRLLIEEGVLPHWPDHNFEFSPGLFAGHSSFTLASKDVRHGAEVWLRILPPDSLKGSLGLESLYLKMGHPALKDHPHFQRSLFLRAESSYTAVAEESVHGFQLAELMERREALLSNEALDILSLLLPPLLHWASVSPRGDLIPPWRIYLAFAPSVTTTEISSCLTTLRLRDWPPFQIKIQLGSTSGDLVRPLRSEWEEILHRLLPATPPTASAAPATGLNLAALLVYLLEYRRYQGLISSGDPRPKPLVACPRLLTLLEHSLLLLASPSPDLRTSFLQEMRNQIHLLAYPHSDSHALPSAGARPHADPIPPALSPPPEPSWVECATSAFQAVRQNQLSLLHRLLRRQTTRIRIRERKPDQLPS